MSGEISPTLDVDSAPELASNRSAFASDALIEVLATRDVHCPVCQYNLRQLQQPRCPECGRRLELSVRATDLPIGIWIASLVAVLPAAPFGVIFLFAMFVEGAWRYQQFRTAAEKWMLVLATYAALSFPAAIFLLIARRRFTRWPRRWQAIFAAIPITLDIAAVITIVCLINA